MKLGISNIAWSSSLDTEVRALLCSQQVPGIEVAPTKIWPAPADVPESEIRQYRNSLNSEGLSVSSMQALLFGRPELTLFGTDDDRVTLLDYLRRIFRIGGLLGGGPMVFGSPKNRLVGDLNRADAFHIAVQFFRSAGQLAAEAGVTLCMEPNPPQYGCDFINTVRQGAELVRAVDAAGFRLHLDSSSIMLNEEDPEQSVLDAFDCIAHFHISEPFLGVPGANEAVHTRIASALQRHGYDRWAVIEMRETTDVSPLESISSAISFARRVYGL